ncbi:PQ-loop repeat-containing protein [uncultured Stenotrophomonas sp.]|uniref:PQ-loop repeat-containing protein n=1 Tax=uncultured Stenotrophomonas sp. TaxID=165438 RepID=UPI0028E9C7C3|nr:PQ-loop repeat-containing protein [uncultured Stenotrophomonas sp.]
MEQPADLLGWAATVVLIATLARQIYKQHQDGASEGVSTWLFIGQMTASVLFIIYSVVLGSTVFVVTNSLILLTAITGQVLAVRRRRHQRPDHRR